MRRYFCLFVYLRLRNYSGCGMSLERKLPGAFRFTTAARCLAGAAPLCLMSQLPAIDYVEIVCPKRRDTNNNSDGFRITEGRPTHSLRALCLGCPCNNNNNDNAVKDIEKKVKQRD